MRNLSLCLSLALAGCPSGNHGADAGAPGPDAAELLTDRAVRFGP